MTTENTDAHIVSNPDAIQPTRDDEATSFADPSDDPAQAEWERTEAIDAGADIDESTAIGADPDELPSVDDEIPATDLPSSGLQPETQEGDPVIAEIGEDGEGDLSPNDL
ncbi:sugar ABC transporter ATPase [Microbacterium sp. NPDC090225]|uniref:sugar ABC transporter ATPase n=1 Tax=Microbacterium sp. NPDC090225 TaxID=3364207 RepID=UPI003830BF6F